MPPTSNLKQTPEVDDPRADLAAAFDKVAEREDPDEDPKKPVGSAGEEEPEADETTGSGEDEGDADDDEGSKPAGEDSDPEEEDDDKPEPGDEGADEGDDKEDKASGDDAGDVESRAPASWDPTVREHWAKLPKAVRDQVGKREREVTQALGQSTNARRFTHEFQQLVGPYEGMLRAQGARGPLEAVGALLQTAGGLRMGSQAQKAELLAGIIRDYDVDLNTLDQFLAGQIKPGAQGDMERLLTEKLKPMQSFMDSQQQRSQQEQESIRTAASAELEKFMTSKEAEFMDDVRESMADILDLAAKRGESLTIQQAYKRAVALDPKISKIISQRKKVEEARKKGGMLNRKKKAASSILGRSPNGGGGKEGDPNAPDDVRSDIAKAIEKHNVTKKRRI